MFCENCGSQIPDGAAACPNCGCPVTAPSPAVSAETPAPAVDPTPVVAPTPVAPTPAPFADAMAGGSVASPVDPVPVGSVLTPTDSLGGVAPAPVDPVAGVNPTPFANDMAGINPTPVSNPAPFAEAMAGAPINNATPGVDPMAGVNPGPAAPMGGIPAPQAPNPAPAPAGGAGTMNIIALICSIISIVFGTLGVIMFGVPSGAIAIATGVAGLILGIGVQKTTNKARGLGAFICGVIGLTLAACFTIGCIGCATCGGCDELKGAKNYACYGCVGGGCMLRCDAERAANKFSKSINDSFNELDYDDLNDLANAFDWD